jgi:methylisocitrate lyase
LAIQAEGAKTPLMHVKELESMGYNVVVYPGSALYAAAWAVRQVMEELISKGTTAGYMNKMFSFNEFNQMIGLDEYLEKEKYYYSSLLKKRSV